MLNAFDWLRRCRSGTELLATLQYLDEGPLPPAGRMGPPHSALQSPCERCWIYPRQAADRYCGYCKEVLVRARQVYRISPHALVIWGFVNHLPASLQSREAVSRNHILSAYLHDERHFLIMLRRGWLKPWIQEVAIRHGTDLKGVVQIVPSMPPKSTVCMGDILCRMVHNEVYLPRDRMHIRFYSDPMQVFNTRKRDRQGLLDFEIAEFLGLLEMAAVFRLLLRPDEQQELFELLTLDDPEAKQFYWGRFLTFLDRRAKDMLTAWNIRKWPRNRIRLLYELIDYVYVDFSQNR